MQRLEVSGAVRPIYGSLGVKRLTGAVRACVYLHVSVYEDVCTASKCIWQESLHTGIKGGDRSGFCCVFVFGNWVSPVLCMVLYSTSFVERLVEGLV